MCFRACMSRIPVIEETQRKRRCADRPRRVLEGSRADVLHPMRATRAFIVAFIVVILAPASSASAQDDAERRYLYRVSPDGPGHAMYPGEKPKVVGWADERIEEPLDRGLIAVLTADRKVYLGWRLLENDDPDIAFHVYRSVHDDDPVRLTDEPVTVTTDFIDEEPVLGQDIAYWVMPVVGEAELRRSEPAIVEADAAGNASAYRSIRFEGDYVPSRSGIAVGDLDGDGAYDFVIKQPGLSIDPGGDPNTAGTTYKLEAYSSDGTFLWRKDLGPGIEPGVWYSPYVVRDLDGDGCAEVAVKTAPGGERDADGRVRRGDERVTVFDGVTGDALAWAPWPERDLRYGDYNRLNRSQMGVAYLDGNTPYLVLARGTYKLMVLDAYQLNDGQLEQAWHWDGDEQNPVIRHQGAHAMISADVDDDSRDEVILGSVVIDDNGLALYSTGFGHPDRMLVSDIDAARPGMEILYGIEDWHMDGNGVVLVEARTGETIWNIGHPTYHIGRAMVADIDATIPGLEIMAWEDPKGGTAGASSDRYMLSVDGRHLAHNAGVPDARVRHWVFWDGDLLREMVVPERTDSGRSITIQKYGGSTVERRIVGDIAFAADLFGDWREEVITVLPGAMHIHTTTLPASDRRTTLMQDPVYRSTVTHNSMGYDQPPVPGFYLGVLPDP